MIVDRASVAAEHEFCVDDDGWKWWLSETKEEKDEEYGVRLLLLVRVGSELGGRRWLLVV